MNTLKTSRIAAVILLPLIAFGQKPTAAAKAEQVLRARVTEFLQYHVDGNFRKAYDFVAAETRDDYFNSGKVQLKGFTIDKIVFSDNFTRANVSVSLTKTMYIMAQEFPATLPSTTTWKIENGKWMWYEKLAGAPSALGGTPQAPPGARSSAATTPAGKDFDGGLPPVLDERTLGAATQSIVQQIGVDKRQVTLLSDRVSEDRVVFHNGMPGLVQLELGVPSIPGFSAKIEQSFVKSGADMPVVFRYEPGDPATPRAAVPTTVELTVQPLNQTVKIQVNFVGVDPNPVIKPQ